MEGLLPPVSVIYSLSNHESETLQAYISENSEKIFIRPSLSSTGAPVLFANKKDGGLHLCVDYHKLNSFTRKNRYPVPPMNQLLTIFNGYTIFSKIDFHGAYNLLRIKGHSSLQYFISSKVLTCHQAHKAELISEFHFIIMYLPGRMATLPDAFSLKDNVYPERGVDFIKKNPQNFYQVLMQDGIQESRFISIKVEFFSDLVDQIQKEAWQYKDYKKVLKKLERGE
ncbi:hypothetical protein O181_016830 [Austropuccinia psidii MF-1]|uniref:Reverse transcriptase domain-containing protein n=1 Tax=Austropuccinia psidii MF-1 TaxID=1389203 RepID=A0A9Q3GSE5_9BASI|nr:hypothetical protein [Austropuccinia psidii MF-1]